MKERDREAAKEERVRLRIFCRFLKRKENTFNVVGKFWDQNENKHTVRTNKSEIQYLSKNKNKSNYQTANQTEKKYKQNKRV